MSIFFITSERGGQVLYCRKNNFTVYDFHSVIIITVYNICNVMIFTVYDFHSVMYFTVPISSNTRKSKFRNIVKENFGMMPQAKKIL